MYMKCTHNLMDTLKPWKIQVITWNIKEITIDKLIVSFFIIFANSLNYFIHWNLNKQHIDVLLWGAIFRGYRTVASTFVSLRSRVQTDCTDKWLYQSIPSDKNSAIDRRFPYRPPSYPHDVRSAAINGQLSTPWTIINHDSRNTRIH